MCENQVDEGKWNIKHDRSTNIKTTFATWWKLNISINTVYPEIQQYQNKSYLCTQFKKKGPQKENCIFSQQGDNGLTDLLC